MTYISISAWNSNCDSKGYSPDLWHLHCTHKTIVSMPSWYDNVYYFSIFICCLLLCTGTLNQWCLAFILYTSIINEIDRMSKLKRERWDYNKRSMSQTIWTINHYKKTVTFHKRSSFMNLYVYPASAVDTYLNNNWIIYPELFMNGKLSKQNTVNSGEMFPGLSEEYILVVYKICTHSLTILVLPWFRVFF